MPYAKNSDLPAAVRNTCTSHEQSVYRKAYNSASEAKTSTGKKKYSATSCYKIAWSAVTESRGKKSQMAEQVPGQFTFMADVQPVADDAEALTFSGLASSVGIDTKQQRVTEKAILSMKSQGERALTAGMGHWQSIENVNSIIGWSTPSIDADDGSFKIDCRLLDDHPYSKSLYKTIKDHPDEIKLSIGGFVPPEAVVKAIDEVTGEEVANLEDFQLNHIFICRADTAVNQETWVSAEKAGLGWQDMVFMAASRTKGEDMDLPTQGNQTYKSWGGLSADEVRLAIDRQLPDPTNIGPAEAKEYWWIKALYEDYAIAEKEGIGYYKITFAVNADGEVELGEFVEVEQQWIIVGKARTPLEELSMGNEKEDTQKEQDEQSTKLQAAYDTVANVLAGAMQGTAAALGLADKPVADTEDETPKGDETPADTSKTEGADALDMPSTEVVDKFVGAVDALGKHVEALTAGLSAVEDKTATDKPDPTAATVETNTDTPEDTPDAETTAPTDAAPTDTTEEQTEGAGGEPEDLTEKNFKALYGLVAKQDKSVAEIVASIATLGEQIASMKSDKGISTQQPKSPTTTKAPQADVANVIGSTFRGS